MRKFNIIDILIVLIIIGAIFLSVSRMGGRPIGGSTVSTITISFFSDPAESFVIASMSEGSSVFQHGTEIFLGRVVDIEVREAREYHPNAEGVLIGSQIGDMVHIIVTTQLELPTGSLNNGLLIGGNRFSVGQTVAFRAGDGILNSRISYLREDAP